MNIVIGDAFVKSLKRVTDSSKFWRFPFWENLYYECKWIIWSLLKYFKIVIKMRPWDSGYILMMQKFQLEILCKSIENGYEEEISRNKKVKDIKRYIELLDNSIKDNYAERCGYTLNDDFSYTFIPTEDNNGFYLEDNCTEEENLKKHEALKKSYELEKEEFIEMGNLFQNIRSWWD